ncbi:MAG: BatD family protein [Myxococcota bacterium]
MIALVWLCAAALGAVQVQLRAEPPALMVGQVGTLKVLVVSGGARDPTVGGRRPPAIPTERGLQSEYAGQSSTFKSMNGRITQIRQYEYQLTAVEEGTWSVGPSELTLTDGSKVRAEAIRIEVRPREALDVSDAPFTVEAGFDATELWEGQVTTLRARFQTRERGAQVQWRLPEFDGLRPPQHGNPDQIRYTIQDPGGSITVQQEIVPLVAVATGARDQGVVLAEVQLPVGQSDVFGLRRMRIEQWGSGRLSVNVRPLPPPPPDFSGLVGEFELVSQLEAPNDNVVVTGQSIPWTLVINGTGALEGLTLPPYAAGAASVYDNDHQVTARIDGDTYRATAAYRRVIVPTADGSLALPPVTLVTFSPAKGKYVTHKVVLPTLTVQQGRDAGASEVVVFGDHAPEVVAAVEAIDVRPPYPWGRSTAPSLAFALPPLLGFAAAPGLMWLGGVGVRRWIERRRARKEARMGPVAAMPLLRRLPADPAERLVVLDQVLRRLEARGAPPERIRPLRMRLGRARFGEGGHDAALEADLLVLTREIES